MPLNLKERIKVQQVSSISRNEWSRTDCYYFKENELNLKSLSDWLTKE
jgi:hypothetical protein